MALSAESADEKEPGMICLLRLSSGCRLGLRQKLVEILPDSGQFVVRIEPLFHLLKLGELRQILRAVGGVERVLVPNLRDQQLQEHVLGDGGISQRAVVPPVPPPVVPAETAALEEETAGVICVLSFLQKQSAKRRQQP
jgi:hypothetical protein